MKAVLVQAAGLDEVSGAPDGPLREADGTGELCNGSQCKLVTEGENSPHSLKGVPQLNRISVADIVLEADNNDSLCVRVMQKRVISVQKENPSWAVMLPNIRRLRRSKITKAVWQLSMK